MTLHHMKQWSWCAWDEVLLDQEKANTCRRVFKGLIILNIFSMMTAQCPFSWGKTPVRVAMKGMVSLDMMGFRKRFMVERYAIGAGGFFCDEAFSIYRNSMLSVEEWNCHFGPRNWLHVYFESIHGSNSNFVVLGTFDDVLKLSDPSFLFIK